MKTYKLVLTSFAYQQLEKIRDYICIAYSAPETARNIIIKLTDTIHSLDTLPLRYKVINEPIGAKQGIRKIRCKNYFIYYYVDESKDTVFILDIIYVKADQNKALHVIVKRM